MLKIVDRDGNTISKSKNLRGIRDYVNNSGDIIKIIDASRVGDNEGLLSILFESGNSYQANFASFRVMTYTFLTNWRGAYGAPISVNGVFIGGLSRNSF